MADAKWLDQLLQSIKFRWERLIDVLSPFLVADTVAGAEETFDTFGIVEPKDSAMWRTVLPEIQRDARERAAELVGKRILADGRIVDNPDPQWAITETTRDRLRELLTEAIDNGWTATQTQRAIMDSEAFSPARALMIARTESAFARGRGHHIAAKESDMHYKEWLDQDGCDICLANVADGRIPIDSAFSSGDMTEPAHPNCRCTIAYYVEKE